MNFIEAAKALEAGLRVAREGWKETHPAFSYKSYGGRIKQDGCMNRIEVSPTDVQKDDWYVYVTPCKFPDVGNGQRIRVGGDDFIKIVATVIDGVAVNAIKMTDRTFCNIDPKADVEAY